MLKKIIRGEKTRTFLPITSIPRNAFSLPKIADLRLDAKGLTCRWRACSGSFLSRMRHMVTQKKGEMTGKGREDGEDGRAQQLNLFPGVCLRDAQRPLSENGQTRFMRGEIIRQITGRITNGISVAPGFRYTRTTDRIYHHRPTWLYRTALFGARLSRALPRANETFVIVPSNSPAFIVLLNDHCLRLETAGIGESTPKCV